MMRPRRGVHAFRELAEAHEVDRAQVERVLGAAEEEAAIGGQLAFGVLPHVAAMLHAPAAHAEAHRRALGVAPRDGRFAAIERRAGRQLEPVYVAAEDLL